MKIILAKSAGFCSGVKRAVELTLAASTAKEGAISTYGPLVHNPQVIELLELREVACVKEIDELSQGLAIIRSHGVPPKEKKAIEDKGMKILDATCPKVVRVQKLVENNAKEGRHVIIVGEPDHPEVKGLKGYGGDDCTVIAKVEDLDSLPVFSKVCLLAQTTQNLEGFEKILEKLKESYPDLVVKNTICAATKKRQDEIRTLASNVDAMIVIGGKASGNTRRLVDIARNECALPTFWIETQDELDEKELLPFEKIGVTAGASTPSWIIDRVMARLNEMSKRRARPVLTRLRKIAEFLVITNLFTSFAAGCLCYLGSVLLDVKFTWYHFSLVFSYVLAMHVLNRFTEKGVDKFRDDPLRQRFYKENSRAMLVMGFLSMALAIALSIEMGAIIFILVLAASIIGVLYSVKVVPKRMFNLVGFRRLKDIAASKNFFVASAWAIVSVFPLIVLESNQIEKTTIESNYFIYTRYLSAFVFLFFITGIRSIYMDLSDIASDRLVGRDSVPIVFGEKRTRRFIKMLLVAIFLFLYVLTYIKVLPSIGYIIGFWILAEFLIMEYFVGNKMRQPSVIRRDLAVDGHFIVAGIVAFAWKQMYGVLF